MIIRVCVHIFGIKMGKSVRHAALTEVNTIVRHGGGECLRLVRLTLAMQAIVR